LFLGVFGADRFYLGEVGLGILKLITFGGYGIWALIDTILLVAGVRKDKWGRNFPDRKENQKLSIIVMVAVLALGVILVIVLTVASMREQPQFINNTNMNTSNDSTTSQRSSTLSAKIGGALALTDQNGNKLSVAVEQVMPNATPTDPAVDGPKEGSKLVAVQVKITNESSKTLSDAVGNDMLLYDTASQSYQPTFDNVSNCQGFAEDSFNLQSGGSATGCEVYDIPITASVGQIKFTPSSGFASDTGVWTAS
jgi:hypothetical protein